MKKKIISVILCLVLVAALFPLYVFSQVTVTHPESVTIDLPEWKLACSGATATSSIPKATNLKQTIKPGYDTSGWVDTAVPCTLQGALVDAGIYADAGIWKQSPDGSWDPYYDDNLSKIPPGDFYSPYWYSTDFDLPVDSYGANGTKVSMTFLAINYTARIFVNGNEVFNTNISILADNELQNRSGSAPNWTYANVTNSITAANSSVGGAGFGVNDFDNYKNLFKGAARTYDVDISQYAVSGANNVKVLVTRPVYKTDSSDNATSGDFSPFWVDWQPSLQDWNGGIIGDVFVTTHGDVRLVNPVATALVAEDLSSADVSFYVEALNFSRGAVSGTLDAAIIAPDGETVVAELSAPCIVPANDGSSELAAGFYHELYLGTYTFEDPELWWPYLSGDQPLYHIEYSFTIDGQKTPSNELTHRFGIRQIDQKVTNSTVSSSSNQAQLQIYVNHLPIIMKGGGYCPTDFMFRHTDFANRAAVDNIKAMGMNCIRDEGKFYDRNLLDLMDENGILLIVGWCCCDRNQNPNAWSKAERWVSYESLYSVMRMNRSHANFCIWLNGSDAPPDNGTNANGQNIARKYLEIEGRMRFYDLGAIACSATSGASNLSGGRSGFHMDSSYDTQTANLYYTSASQGSFGFISEGHGGAGIPYIETLKKMIPAAALWPYNLGHTGTGTGPGNYNMWNVKSARATFANIDNHQVLVDNTYGASTSLEIANYRAQLFQYEIERASYEALNFYRFNQSTGIINWMLNSPQPGIMWNQFDYYMNPYGRTFGAGKANEPIHIMYNPAIISGYNPTGQAVRPTACSISIVNSTPDDYGALTATATIYDINGKIINTPLVKTVNVGPDGIYGYTGTITQRAVGYKPNGNWISGGFTNFMVDYAQVATGSSGLTVLWTNDDINNSLIFPTSDVYFLRLELADSDGNILSYNNYAVPRRQDVNGTASSWARGTNAQTQDLTQLNALPAIDMVTGLVAVQTGSLKDVARDEITQTIKITNNTDTIAYGVDIKAYMDETCKDLVAPSIYSDNMLIIFPGQTRTVTVMHYASVLDKDSVITVNCYNNAIVDKPRLGNVYDPMWNRNAATPAVGTATTNLVAKGLTVTGLNNTNATTLASVALSNAAFTVLDSNINTVSTVSVANGGSTGFSFTLGAAPVKFDKVNIRWNAAGSTGGNPNMLAGVPRTVTVQTSDDNATWTTVKVFDNLGAMSCFTDIELETTQTARYIRILASGVPGASAAYGTVTGFTGTKPSGFKDVVNARAAATNFNVNSIEVYAFRTSVYLDLVGSATAATGGTTYTSAMTALRRSVTPDASGNITLAISGSAVFRDGVDVTSQLVDGQLVLTNVTADTVIKVTQ